MQMVRLQFFPFIMKHFDYPVAPGVLGIILTSLLEENYRRGIVLKKSVGGLIGSIFTSPISLVLFLVIVAMLATQTKPYKEFKKKREAAKAAK